MALRLAADGGDPSIPPAALDSPHRVWSQSSLVGPGFQLHWLDTGHRLLGQDVATIVYDGARMKVTIPLYFRLRLWQNHLDA